MHGRNSVAPRRGRRIQADEVLRTSGSIRPDVQIVLRSIALCTVHRHARAGAKLDAVLLAQRYGSPRLHTVHVHNIEPIGQISKRSRRTMAAQPC